MREDGSPSRCEDCDNPGNGRCAKCYGTGKNLKLNSDREKCDYCRGTAICAYCQGTGVMEESFSDLIPEWLERLFKKLLSI